MRWCCVKESTEVKLPWFSIKHKRDKKGLKNVLNSIHLVSSTLWCWKLFFILSFQMWRLRYFVSISNAFGASQRGIRTLERFRGISKTVLSTKQERRFWLFWFGDVYKRCGKRGLGETFVDSMKNGFHIPLDLMTSRWTENLFWRVLCVLCVKSQNVEGA